mgnify:CR=1 FL=1
MAGRKGLGKREGASERARGCNGSCLGLGWGGYSRAHKKAGGAPQRPPQHHRKVATHPPILARPSPPAPHLPPARPTYPHFPQLSHHPHPPRLTPLSPPPRWASCTSA